MVAEWLNSWLAEQEVRGSISRLAAWISEIGKFLLPSRNMAEIPLKRRKSYNNQPTNYFAHNENSFIPPMLNNLACISTFWNQNYNRFYTKQ